MSKKSKSVKLLTKGCLVVVNVSGKHRRKSFCHFNDPSRILNGICEPGFHEHKAQAEGVDPCLTFKC